MSKDKDEKGKFNKGHKVNEKLDTKELKIEAYRQYCEHIAQGYPKKAWCFVHPELSLTWQMMERYLDEYKDDPIFNPLLMELAHSKAYKTWFEDGKTITKGGFKNASPQTWATIMRNMFDWDKDNRVQNTVETEVRKIINRWES